MHKEVHSQLNLPTLKVVLVYTEKADMFLSALFEERLAGTFDKYGKLIARNPVSAIMFAIMLNGLLAINILWMRSNSDVTVYIPSKSQAYLDTQLVRNYFPDFTGTNFYDQSLLDLAGGNWVSNTGHLGRAGVVSSGLSILGALGLGSALQIEFVNIVGVMPFLIIGIGVDDMFILMSGLASAPFSKSIEERVGQTMQSNGVAITITSLTNVTAFAVGLLSTFQSVRHFCIYTGLALLLCYVNQMTFFLGCMTIHERRVAANRHCITCLPTKSKEEMNNEGENCLKKSCCGGSPPSSRSEQESVFQKFPSVAIPKLVLWLPFKILVIVGFVVYLGFSIWGVVHLQNGLLLQNLVSESSYYHSYSIWNYDHFPSKFIISLIFPSNISYESSETQNLIADILTEIKQDQDINTENEINWLISYRSSNLYDNSSGQSFGMNLKEYISEYIVLK
ncbi:unnamed protein product [Mytilus edulis]|uniref:SSD domain-containing protein n=1 Tax=Mytilus edulis TaxID=6550 RepID=A0A8S3URY1_MYTED|nr:unnamed protein product [Mytilus edulis]